MKNIFSIFQGVFTFFKTIKKSMYRNCAIIASGTAVIAVISFSSTAFGGTGKSNALSHIGANQDELMAEKLAAEDDEDILEAEAVFALADANLSPAPLMLEMTKVDFTSKRVDAKADDTNDDMVSAGTINPIITITDEDYTNLVRIVEAEATGLDVKAKILVANVVINRVFSKDFPNTVTEVIFQGNGEQFMPIADGRFYSVGLTESSYEAVDRALVGEDYSDGALFFASTASTGPGSWFATHLVRLFDYNGHVFFTY